jgi:hypothetical protein
VLRLVVGVNDHTIGLEVHLRCLFWSVVLGSNRFAIPLLRQFGMARHPELDNPFRRRKPQEIQEIGLVIGNELVEVVYVSVRINRGRRRGKSRSRSGASRTKPRLDPDRTDGAFMEPSGGQPTASLWPHGFDPRPGRSPVALPAKTRHSALLPITMRDRALHLTL